MNANFASMNMDDILNDANNANNSSNTVDNINKYKNIIFTDGAFSRNGKKAGFGIYIGDKTEIECLKQLKLYKKFKLVNFNINQELSMTGYLKPFIYDVTNIRAEGYAILYTLILFKSVLLDNIDKSNVNDVIDNLNLNYLENKQTNLFPHNDYKKNINVCNSNSINSHDILIVTDSEFWIKTITIWSKSWYKKDLILERKNIDIVLNIMYYYNLLLSNSINVEFQHVKGHSDKHKKQFYTYYENGNIEADLLAVKAKESNDILLHLD